MLSLRKLILLFCPTVVSGLIFSAASASAFAFSWPTKDMLKNAHPVVSIGAGAALSSDLGAAKTFPISNPATSERYQYAPTQPTETSGLFQGFLGAEWQVHPKWLAQFGLDYNQTASFSSKGTFTQGADSATTSTYNYYYRVNTKQLLAESKWLYTFRERYHPYFLVGLGAAFNRAYNYYTNVPPFLAFTRAYRNNTNTAFSYALGFGLDTNIRRDLRLGVGYRFTNLGQATLGKAVIDTTAVGGTLSQSHLYENQLLAQLTFIF